ncbi:Wadjet anti-phage system protein JetD domain-containing protein [Alkalihalobacillus sp. BA299]|uniref:Wadjet anti-phage system protein JetD domain-containing protein n=1 Tax=Alkalihalobacillus sp. BA299 TaxID=2815938 RepID=UPI0027DCE310|nr:Wadjet anti-phage system protein JetD domain-containing protein [Alkalihalobacillus sp. BA299]
MKQIKNKLATYSKKSVSIQELEQLIMPFIDTYDQFATEVLELEQQSILQMVKSKGRTSRNPSLALQYRINKSLLVEGLHKEIQKYRTQLDHAIQLDTYFSKDPSVWKEDLPYLLKIDQYIKKHSFSLEAVPAPERSFELVADEKWIEEKGGKELLERIGLWERFNIIPVADPLMFAINPKTMKSPDQLHLIVENKTTYQGLLPVLTETIFSTLIYGSGKKIIKSIEQFNSQYPVEANHSFYYFGDVDNEGVSIWYSLSKVQHVELALPFYHACLLKQAATGKENQKGRKEAIDAFLHYFSLEIQSELNVTLGEGKYFPQEILKAKELQQIWKETDWTT